MMINIDYKRREPIYEQIVMEVERYVSLGILKPKEQMPSVRTLATELGINPNTVKKAYDILEARGVIETFSTKGTFIVEEINSIKTMREKELFDNLKETIQELEKIGLTKEQIIAHLTKD